MVVHRHDHVASSTSLPCSIYSHSVPALLLLGVFVCERRIADAVAVVHLPYGQPDRGSDMQQAAASSYKSVAASQQLSAPSRLSWSHLIQMPTGHFAEKHSAHKNVRLLALPIRD